MTVPPLRAILAPGSAIHRHASFKKPTALFEELCGKFDAKYYTDYLTEKFTKLYKL